MVLTNLNSSDHTVGHSLKAFKPFALALVSAPVCLTAQADSPGTISYEKAVSAQQTALSLIRNNPLDYSAYQEAQTIQLAPLKVPETQNYGTPLNINPKKAQSNQITLQRNKAELDAALDQCDDGGVCAPGVASYRRMLQTARRVPDSTVRAGFINAWVNLTIHYDFSTPHNHRRTLTQALVDHKGVCDEQAQLKLYALDATGTPPQSARLVLAALRHQDGSTTAHAFVMTRTNGTNWVMDNQATSTIGAGAPAESRRIIGFDSMLMWDVLHANLPGQAQRLPGSPVVIPRMAMTHDTITTYRDANAATVTSSEAARTINWRRKMRRHIRTLDLSEPSTTMPPMVQRDMANVLQQALRPSPQRAQAPLAARQSRR